MVFQRRTWQIERASWVALVFLVAAALLGVFAKGPLSEVRAGGAAHGLEVECQRFARNGAAERITLRRVPAGDGGLSVRIDGETMRAFEIEAIHPRPDEEQPSSGGIALVYRQGVAPVTLFLDVRPRTVGPVRSAFSVPGRPPVLVTRFVYP